METHSGHTEPLDVQVHQSNAMYGKMGQSHLYPPPLPCTQGSLYTPFTFRGLVDFLIIAEGRVDSLGNTPLGRSDAAMQLINMGLIAPAATQQLPITIAERNQIEHRQMRLMFAENPHARRYKRVATLWARWIDSFGAQYPRAGRPQC